MAEIINLNKARKTKARAQKEENAAANRANFGRTKAEKASVRRGSEQRDKHLDGVKKDPE